MSQIMTKWIADGAITPAKLDSNGDYTVGSISVNILDTSNIVTSSIISLSEAYDVPALDASSSDSETPAIIAQHSTGAAIVALSGDGIAVSALNNSSTFVALKAENVAPGGTCFEAQTASVDGTAVSIIANTEASSIALQAFGVVDVNGSIRAFSDAYDVSPIDASSVDSETPAIQANHWEGQAISAITGDSIAVSIFNTSPTSPSLKVENTYAGGKSFETFGLAQFGLDTYEGTAIKADNSSVDPTVTITNNGLDGGSSAKALEVSGKALFGGPVQFTDALSLYNEFSGTLVSFENGYEFDPDVVTLEVKGKQGTTITASSYDGTTIKAVESAGGLAAHFDGNILSENGTVTLGSSILDKSIILADNSSIDPTVRFQNLGTDAVALEVSGKTNLGGPTSVFDTLTVQSEFASTLVTFNNELIDEPAAITLDVQGLQGTTIKAVSSNDGTAIKAISTGTGLAGHFEGNSQFDGNVAVGSGGLRVQYDNPGTTVLIENAQMDAAAIALEISASDGMGIRAEAEDGTSLFVNCSGTGMAAVISGNVKFMSGDIMVDSDIGDTTAAVIGGVTFNFTKGILTSIT